MSKATLFTDGENQVVKLPKGVRFEGVAEVEIKREGESVILTPKRKPCKSPDDSPNSAKPEDGLPMGDALATIWGEVGLTDNEFAALKREIAKNKRHVEPVKFD